MTCNTLLQNDDFLSGMIHAGLGETHVNNFLTELNIPKSPHKTLKRREREVGSIIDAVGEASCRRSLLKELNAGIFFICITDHYS